MKAKLVLFLVSVVSASALAHKVDLSFESLNLRNGKTLAKGTIKSYDPATGRVVVQVNREINSYQIEMLPEDTAARIATLVPDTATDAALTEKAQQAAEARARAEAQRQERERMAKEASAARMRRTQGVTNSPAPADAIQARAKNIAYTKAYNYYRYEFRPASGSVLIMGQGVQVDEPVAVVGWDRRYRVTGTVGLQFYDSRGRSFDRSVRSFEVLVGPDSNGNAVVLDFTAK